MTTMVDKKEQEALWILTHGSEYLKRATRLGYPCTWRYLRERAEHDLPEGFFAMQDHGQWIPVDEPSENALDMVESLLAQGHSATVVKTLNGGEAVIIRDFLGYYRVVAICLV